MDMKDMLRYASPDGTGQVVYCMRSAGGLEFAKAIAYEVCCKELAAIETSDGE